MATQRTHVSPKLAPPEHPWTDRQPGQGEVVEVGPPPSGGEGGSGSAVEIPIVGSSVRDKAVEINWMDGSERPHNFPEIHGSAEDVLAYWRECYLRQLSGTNAEDHRRLMEMLGRGA
jgi:hypothetical protein